MVNAWSIFLKMRCKRNRSWLSNPAVPGEAPWRPLPTPVLWPVKTEYSMILSSNAASSRAETIHDALDWCHYLANSPIPEGENTVIITNGGGIGVLAADACEKYNVNLYDDLQNLTKTFSRRYSGLRFIQESHRSLRSSSRQLL